MADLAIILKRQKWYNELFQMARFAVGYSLGLLKSLLMTNDELQVMLTLSCGYEHGGTTFAYEMLHQEGSHWRAHVGAVDCSMPAVGLQVLATFLLRIKIHS